MVKSFKNLLEKLINAIDETNEQLIKNMLSTEYYFACVEKNVTYEEFYTILSSKWNKVIDEIVSNKDTCMTISEFYCGEKILKQINNIPINSLQTPDVIIKSDFETKR